jgi:sigma-E factor negative regulatory protein RseA
MNDKLSALMDNELDEIETRRLWAALPADAAARAAWGRYHLIRAALRREPVTPAADIAEAVAARVAALPAPAGRRPLARLAGQLALAASVAAVVLVGAREWLGGVSPPAPVAAQRETPVEYLRAQTRWNTNERAIESALNGYLVEHNEFAPSAGVSGMLPYVRVVGYEPAVSGDTAEGAPSPRVGDGVREGEGRSGPSRPSRGAAPFPEDGGNAPAGTAAGRK